MVLRSKSSQCDPVRPDSAANNLCWALEYLPMDPRLPPTLWRPGMASLESGFLRGPGDATIG